VCVPLLVLHLEIVFASVKVPTSYVCAYMSMYVCMYVYTHICI